MVFRTILENIEYKKINKTVIWWYKFGAYIRAMSTYGPISGKYCTQIYMYKDTHYLCRILS